MASSVGLPEGLHAAACDTMAFKSHCKQLGYGVRIDVFYRSRLRLWSTKLRIARRFCLTEATVRHHRHGCRVMSQHWLWTYLELIRLASVPCTYEKKVRMLKTCSERSLSLHHTLTSPSRQDGWNLNLSR